MKKLLLTAALACTAMLNTMAVTVTVSNSPVTCNGSCNGTAMATPSGTGGMYTYSWVGPGSFTASTQNISGLCAGTYTVTVMDMGDMSTASANTTITEPTALTVTLPSYYPVCYGSSVTLNAVPGGGSGGYTFNWAPNYAISSVMVANPTVNVTTNTTYTVTVADAHGCFATATTTVYVDNIHSNLHVTNTSACTMCNGSITSSTLGGTAPYTYTWSTGSGPVTSGTISSLCAGAYYVTITDAEGCMGTDTAVVSAPPMYADFTVVPDSVNGDGVWTFNSTIGTGSTFTWDFGDGFTATGVNPTHVYAAPGTYSVCLSVSNGSCSDTQCHSITITGTPASCLALFNIGDDINSADPNDLTVYNLSYGATLSYLWDFGDGSTSNDQDPTHVYAGMGPYQLCLTVDNGAGCTQMYCDSIMSVDSLGRSTNLSMHVQEVPVQVTLGIAEASAGTAVNVYPNPVTDQATFIITSAKQGEVYTLELTDVVGNKVRTVSGISKKQFNISREGLQNGVYFYKIYTSDKNVGIGKLIVK